ncbi:MAG: helix-turn-helix domain-containing protein [Treponema sp.]|nr:helix-turn-helix domain-containing protein [Treponema sp.]
MKEILIRLREKNRYTQTAMAKLLDVSRQSYMKYETGEVEPPVEVIRKLQKIYNVPYDVLIDNKVDFVDSPAKNTIQNSSLEEFATMLFSVASSLQNANLTLEEKLTKFEVYAKLAEVQMDIANGDKGTDAFEFLESLRKK